MKKTHFFFKYFVISVFIFISGNLSAQQEKITPLKKMTEDKTKKMSNAPITLPEINNALSIIINVPGSYPTIQAAINAANNGDIITVDPGIYREDLTLNKLVHIRGANFGVNPNTGSRGSESVIQPFSSDPDPNSPTGVTILYIGANGSGSTIDGFTIDGDNTTINSGVVVNGADLDAVEAISAYEGLSNTTFSNNIVKNTNYSGIDYYNYYNAAASTYDNIITNNRFDNINPSQFGIGIIIYNNCYASITTNVMTRVRVGVQTGNFSKADLGTNHSISSNEIESYRIGIWHNLTYTNATTFTIANNIITTVSGAPNNWGIEISSVQNSVAVNLSNNNVTGARSGYYLWNCPTTNNITVTGGTVAGCKTGLLATNYHATFFNADPSVYAMTGVTMTNCDTAIWVQDNNLNSNSATVSLNINNATNIVNGTGIGLLVEGADASVTFNGAVPVDFSTSLSKYIRLITNGSNVPAANINALNVQFGGTNGSGLTDAQLFAVEDKIDHKIDWGTLGFVIVKVNHDFVTSNSFYSPNTTSPSIQRGIDAASNGFTINVTSGTFIENFVINKNNLLLKGANYGINPNTGIRGAESIIMPSANDPETGVLVSVQQSNIIMDGFLLDGDNPGLGVGYAVGSADVNTSEGIANASDPIFTDPFFQIDHIDIQNNIFNNFDYQAVYFEVDFNSNHSWNYIKNNKFDNMWEGVQTYAMHADISYNVFTRVDRALSMHAVHAATDLGFLPQIAYNDASITWKTSYSRNIGIWVNYRDANAPDLEVKNNTINCNDPSLIGKKFFGFYALTLLDDRKVAFTDNIINGYDKCSRGFYMTNCPSQNITLTGGSFNNIKDYGILMVNNDLTWGPGDVKLTVDNLPITMSPGAYTAVLDSADNNFVMRPLSQNDLTKRLNRKEPSEIEIPTSSSSSSSSTFSSILDISNSTLTGGLKGIAVSGTLASASIHDNSSTITGATIGVDIDGGSSTLYRNNITANVNGVRVKNSGSLVSATENFITSNTANAINIEATAGSIGTISDNDLSGNTGYAINYLKATPTLSATCNWYGAVFVPSKIFGNVNYINFLTNGSDNEGGTPGFQPVPASCTGLGPVVNLTQSLSYVAIAPAIAAANPGDVIEISAGTYNERVVIDKSLTLQGTDKPNCIIDGTGLAGTGKGIQINNGITNVTIKHLTVQNFAGAGGNTDAGIYGIGGNNNLLIRGVIIQNNVGGSGFYANGPVNTVTIDSALVSGHTTGARGIVIWNGLKENITVTNCEVFNNNCCGVELQDGQASGVTIENNNIHDNFDNGIGLIGLQGPGENLVKMNTVTNNGRFGIEIKNPNGSGLATGAGRVVVENNTVTRTLAIVDARDICGIAAFRRGVLAGNVDVPNGVVIQNNTVSGYTQPSTSEGFGIVVEGTNHTVSANNVSGCDVGIQRQKGHLPYPGDGDQNNVADTYFGRGNSPQTCGVILTGNILSNTINTRVVGGAGAGLVTNLNTTETFCSIQSAIDDAQTLTGHVIEVSAGIYNERVTLNKSLTLQGTDKPNCIIDGTGLGNGKGIQINNGITGVTIQHLTVQNFTGAGGNTDAGIYGIGGNNNLLIRGVIIQNNVGGSGFYANGPVNTVTIDSALVSGHTTGARGIVIWNGLKENITVTNCEVFNNNCCGVELQDGQASGVTIENNNIHDNFDNGIGLIGLQGPGENLVKMNTVTNNGRFGIEIKNPNGSGLATGAGRVVIENNTVTRTLAIVDARDICGIAAFRRGVLAGNVDVPTGVVIQNNTVSGYTQPSTSEGFGIVVEGTNHTVSANNVSLCDVGIQRQAGHLPGPPGDGDQSNLADTYFGRGNSAQTCGVILTGNILSNTINTRDVGPNVGGGIVVNINSGKSFCSIQAAINDVLTLNGHTIEVPPGSYNEQVLVNKGVIIKGVGAVKPVVDFTGTVSGKPTLFDVSVQNVTLENIRMKVDLTKLSSAVIASGTNINNITITSDSVEAYASSAAGSIGGYGNRNAFSINYNGGINYRIATSGVNNITVQGSTVSGVPNDGFGNPRYFRSAVSVDEGGGLFTNNIFQSINHDVIVRFGGNGNIDITNNQINGGGVELADMNAGAGILTVSGNTFDAAYANVASANAAVLRLKNNYNSKTTSVNNNIFLNHQWAVSLENYNTVTVDNNSFTPLASSTTFHHITVNTKSISGNSNTIVQVPLGLILTNNTFNYSGTTGGTALSFHNHDNDAAMFGTITLGTSGNENNFNSGISNFVYLDNQTGLSNTSVFPPYSLVISGAGSITSMGCWANDLNIENNKFDVGAGLQLPAAMNFAQRSSLETALFHKPDNSCLGSLMFFAPVHNITQDTYFMTINSAITAANPSDTIECAEYTFNEKVIINKTLTLQGVDKVNCKIDGTGLGNGKGIQINNGITDVTIQHLTVQNFSGAGGNTDAGIYGIGGNNNLLIRGVIIQNNVGGSGFYANGPVNTVTIDSALVSGHTTGARGIVIWNGLKENITVTNCEVFNNNCCGVELQDGQASGVTIENNNIHDNFDNGIGLIGLQGPGENLVKMNTVTNNGRFGIEIKNPNGSGLTTGAGRVVIENNTVTRTLAIVDARDICGIAAFRRGVLAGNVDVPNGTVIQNNTVSGYTQPSTSDGFGIVVEGTNHTVSSNNVSGCDVGIQRQAGHLPGPPGDGDQSNLADTYFGRGNSAQTCGVILTGNILSNTINTRDVGAGSGIVKNNNTNKIFCSIQSAIDDATTLNGHVINVDSGYYNESVTINKQLTIVGNGGAPNSRPTVEGVSLQTFSVTVPNVTIDNVIVKFNQGTVNTGIRAATSGGFNNLTVKNSCVFGTGTTGAAIFNSFGIQLGTFGGVLFDQVNLDGNEIKHTGTSPIGRGVKAFNCYGDWKNSSITGFYSIQSGDIGGGLLNITNDSLRGETEINSLGTGAHSFSNNVCNVSNAFGSGTDFALLELKNVSSGGASLSVSGNTFGNYVNFGVFSGRSNNVTIDNNVFTPDLTAVNFRSIRIDTKQRTTAVQSAFASGALITNNTFNGNTALGQAGISVELANSDNVSSFGTVTVGNSGNENDFNNNVKKNISLNNETTSTSGDPIWTGTYISTKAKVNVNLDGINNTYNVGAGFESPSAMSLANLFLLEDKIQHKIDDSGLGFVTVKANNDYVTVNSFVSPATTAPSIQRAIDASSASWTVNVNDGTYNEDIDINKAVSVVGKSTAAIIRGLYAGSANTVFMSVSNSLIRNVTVTRDYGANLAAWNACTKNQGISLAQLTTGITIDEVILTGNRNAIFVNNAQNVTITQCTIEDNRTGVHFGNNVSGAEVHNNFIRNNFTHGVLFNYDLATTVIPTNVQVTNNSITGNWYSQVNFQRNSGPVPTGDHTGLSFSCNWYGTTMPSIVAANAAEPGYTSQTPSQFGGTDPGLNRQLYGIEIAKCPYMPWLTDGTDNYIDTTGFQPVPGSCNGLLSKLYVNDNDLSNDVFTSAVGNDANLGTPGAPFATLAYAVSVAGDRDTIYVDAGTYVEQVNINKSLTVIGADSAGLSAATIKAPAVLNPYVANLANHYPVIFVSGSDTVNISHVCVDGDGRGGANFSGVYYYEASGTFTNSKIIKVRDASFSGVQSGNAFFANHTYDASFNQTVTVSNNVIEDYQKTGILINELNTHGIVTNNIVTGQSVQHVNGQNGIQFGYGAYGTITGNTVTGNQYNGPANDDASGILIAGAGVDQNNVPTGQTTTIGGAGALANIMNGNEVGLLTDGGGYGYDSNAGVIYNANTFNVNYIHVSESSPNTVPSGSNVYDKRIDNPAQTNIVYGQIQRSVDDADANDILNVSAHTFTEQVEIHKAVTLSGQGSGLTTILSPNSLALSFMTADINKPIIYVHDTSGVIIKNLTVDGAGKGNANYRFQGIAYRNAGGKIRNCEIKDIRETPINGNQHGVGIYVFDDDGNARTLEVVNNTITGFQKNATTFLGADLTARIDSNVITGAGPVNFIAQNGIQLSNDAAGSISYNTVSGFSYTPGSYVSCAILVDGTTGDVTTSHNTVSASQMGIYYYNVGGVISENNISATAANTGVTDYWGIDADPGDDPNQKIKKVNKHNSKNKPADEPHLKIQKYESLTAFGLKRGNSSNNLSTFVTNISRNVLTSNGTNGTGIIMVALGTDILNATATENKVNGWEAGVVFDKDAGATLNGVVNYNDLSGNVYSLYDFTGVLQNATCNWYGSTDNTIISPTVVGSVNYIPYLTNGTDSEVDTTGFQPVPATCNGIPASVINIKVIPEGFYNTTTQELNMNDTVVAYLHSNITPYNVIDSSASIIDSVTFTGSFTFSQPSGTYYIVIKHRNSIETWSKSGGEPFVAATAMNYDFTDASSKAYQNNMKLVDASPTVYGIFSGDVNQDGYVELSDINTVFNDGQNFVTGYVVTDVTGDNIVDLTDLSITWNNAAAFVEVKKP